MPGNQNVTKTSKAKKCLVCSSPAGPSRGLCVKHYAEWNRKWKSFPAGELRDEFEQLSIDNKLVLPSRHQGARAKGPFDEVYEQVHEKRKKYEISIAADIAEQIENEIKDTSSKKKASKKKSSGS